MRRNCGKRKPDEDYLLDLLKNIDKGKVSIKLDEKASKDAIEIQSGIYQFNTSNKWTIGVFVDCGEFDYIDHFAHGATKVDYDQIEMYYPKVVEYSRGFRDPDRAKKVWGIEKRSLCPAKRMLDNLNQY